MQEERLREENGERQQERERRGEREEMGEGQDQVGREARKETGRSREKGDSAASHCPPRCR